MDFMAANQGGNPFLMDDDYSVAAATDNGNYNSALNPFLSAGDFDATANNGAAELNPFLSGDFSYPPPEANSASTNPFAAFGMEEPEQFPGINDSSITFDEHINEPIETNNTIDFFAAEPIAEKAPEVPSVQPSVNSDFFSSPERPSPVRPQVPTMEPLHLTGDASEYSAENASIFDETESELVNAVKDHTAHPGRPPPPRPVPPSRETQQLILSVTGAMEATSFDLLDRLRATKTPSPTPMRELHTPSPTHDLLGEQADFLLTDDTPAPPPPSATIVTDESGPQTAANFMDLFGSNNNSISTEPAAVSNQIHVVPASNDLLGFFVSEESTPAPIATAVASAPPPRPPMRPPAPKTPTPPQEADLLGDFSSSVVIEEKSIASSMSATPSPPFMVATAPAAMAATAPAAMAATAPAAMAATAPAAIAATAAPTAATPAPTYVAATAPAAMVASPAPAAMAATPAPAPMAATPAPAAISTSITPAFMAAAPPVAPRAPPRPPSPAMAATAPIPPVPQHPVPSKTQTSAHFAPRATAVETEPFYSAKYVQNVPEISYSPAFATPPNAISNTTVTVDSTSSRTDDFDAFTAKFESAASDNRTTDNSDPFFDAFGGTTVSSSSAGEAWGQESSNTSKSMGFGTEEDQFDAFLSMSEPPPVPQSTPARNTRQESADSDEGGTEFNVFIKPKAAGDFATSQMSGVAPALAPPPKSPVQNTAFADDTPRFNPFDLSGGMTNEHAVTMPNAAEAALPYHDASVQPTFQRTDSQETPQTPLFDDDTSQPLEEFPRIHFTGDGWEMHLRQPNKKKITGQRFWKKVFVRLVYQGDNPVLQLSNTKDDKDPFQELPLQPCYSISDIGAQQFDQYGKIFTVKLQYVFYKERPGVRPGQVTKAERITNKLSQFAAYAIQGDYQGVKEFGSDLRKLGLPVEHAPQISQLLKIGSQNYEDMKQFSVTIEEALFRMPAHRDRALNYKMEEVQITAVDELYLEQDMTGHVCRQIARVRIFFLGFISGMPDLELGVNDIMRQGKEVVGRHDIIPVVTEEWIRLEKVEFHSSVLNNEYEDTRVIKFKPPDACYIELLRFRVRPPKNRELPLQTKCVICVTGNKIEIKCDILVPGFSSRKLGQIPCEDIMVRIPIPECWIYLFRVEKHFRYGSVKSAHRRTGKIKGIERFLGTVESMEPSLIEVTSGSAKYEHQHHAIVWRIHRLPKEGQGAYTNHEFVCRFQLTSYDQIPDELAKYCYMEFTMPSTHASHTTVRSLSVLGDRDEDPPEKCVRHLARMEYRIEIEHTQGAGPGDYLAATTTHVSKSVPEPVTEQPEAEKDSDSDSSS